MRQLARAFAALSRLPRTRLRARSPLYRTEPIGPPGQPDYINAVAALETRLSPRRLLAELHRIERRQGRIRPRRWGPRTLDLDLLLYGRRRRRTLHLMLPHPRLHQRRFVLRPLADLAPTLRVPGWYDDRGRVSALLAACAPARVERLTAKR